MVRLLARCAGRSAHLIWLDVPPDTALAGQRSRGRLVRARAFAAHVKRADASVPVLRAGREPGWSSILLTDRTSARRGLELSR